MQKFLFCIVFAGLISALPSMGTRHRELKEIIQEELQYMHDERNEEPQNEALHSAEKPIIQSGIDNDDWYNSDSDLYYSDTSYDEYSTQSDYDSDTSYGEDSTLSDYDSDNDTHNEPEIIQSMQEELTSDSEYRQEKYEKFLTSKRIKDKHITLSLRALQKELAELKNKKGNRRYKELYRIYSNFLRDMEAAKEQQKTLDPNNKHPENGLSLPERTPRTSERGSKKNRNAYRLMQIHRIQEEPVNEATVTEEEELVVPPNNPDQQRIHINHRQLDSSNFSNRLQKSKKPKKSRRPQLPEACPAYLNENIVPAIQACVMIKQIQSKDIQLRHTDKESLVREHFLSNHLMW